MGSRGWVWSASAGPAPPLLLLAPLPRPGLSLLLLRSPRPPLPSRPVRPAGGGRAARLLPPAGVGPRHGGSRPPVRGRRRVGGRALAASRPPLRAAPGWVVWRWRVGGGGLGLGWRGPGGGSPLGACGARLCVRRALCRNPSDPAGVRLSFRSLLAGLGHPLPHERVGDGAVPCSNAQKSRTTLSGGSLGSCVDEERS